MSTQKQFPVLLGVNVVENDSDYRLKIDISRFQASRVDVSTWEDSLIIEMVSEGEPNQSYYLGEMETETYRRVIPMAFPIDGSKVETHNCHGILEINVCKPENARATHKQAVSAAS